MGSSGVAVENFDEVGDLSLLETRTLLPRVPPAIIPFLSTSYMMPTTNVLASIPPVHHHYHGSNNIGYSNAMNVPGPGVFATTASLGSSNISIHDHSTCRGGNTPSAELLANEPSIYSPHPASTGASLQPNGLSAAAPTAHTPPSVANTTVANPDSALQVVLYRDRHVVLCNRNTGALRARMLSNQQQTTLETVKLVQCPLCSQPVNPCVWSFEAQSYFNLLQDFFLAKGREKRHRKFAEASARGRTGNLHSRRTGRGNRSSSAQAAYNFMSNSNTNIDYDPLNSDEDYCTDSSVVDGEECRGGAGRQRQTPVYRRVTSNPFSPLLVDQNVFSATGATTYAGETDAGNTSAHYGYHYGHRMRVLLESDHRLQLKSDHRRGVLPTESSNSDNSQLPSSILSNNCVPFSKSIAQTLLVTGYYSSFFREVQKLGSGSFGQVYFCHHVLDDLLLGEYAVKKVPVGDDRFRLKDMSREVKIRENLHHPNIVEYKHSWLEMHRANELCPFVPWLFVLMEYCNGGDLESLFWDDNGHANRLVPEQVIWKLFVDILQGLHSIHHSGILHRDMKLSNILLHHSTDEVTHQPIAKALLADFGTAQKFTETQWASSSGNTSVEGRCGFTGTVEYTAPELLATDERGSYCGGYDIKSDMWSFGVVLYALAFGATPFSGTGNWDPTRIQSAVLAAPDVIPYPQVPPRSANLCLLIQALLTKEPSYRPSTDDLLYHPTLKELFASPTALSEASALLAQFMRCRRSQ
eukprot:Lankesteria_metandrocarpae@DN3547_c0_g1_i1.p1